MDGDPDALLSESEKKAKDFFPELAVLKVNLLFGKYCNSLLIRNAIESLENEQAVLDYNDMSSKFEPVYEEDFFKALKELKPGERVVLGGPEKLSWRKIVEQLAAGLGK